MTLTMIILGMVDIEGIKISGFYIINTISLHLHFVSRWRRTSIDRRNTELRDRFPYGIAFPD
jgi:hypothetical protein